jgi:hypothetical protein
LARTVGKREQRGLSALLVISNLPFYVAIIGLPANGKSRKIQAGKYGKRREKAGKGG